VHLASEANVLTVLVDESQTIASSASFPLLSTGEPQRRLTFSE